jgi:hypothetical protein
MKLLLSGEGPTDIGSTRLVPGGSTFVPGSMAVFVDALIEPTLGYSLLDAAPEMDCVRHVPESELASRSRALGPPVLPGQKRPKGYAGYVKAAQTLGALAQEERGADGAQPVLAVLFRDTDGTQSAPRDRWQQVVNAISGGFERAGFDTGVPMVPRPKSEAWLLCALKDPAYQHCEALEDAPGNDRSPRSLKGRLFEVVGHEATAGEQAQWVRERRVDPMRIEMPSFAAFREALEQALRRIGLAPAPRADGSR